jgi:hypothetical protein
MMIIIIGRMYDSILVTEHVLYPTYSSTLDNHSATFAREECRLPEYFYEALAFNVSVAGDYSFWSHSDFDTYGYLYRDDFNRFETAMNRLSSDDDNCEYQQFNTVHRLLPNITYILVVTTSQVGETGKFSVISSGPASMQFSRVGK